MSNIKSYLSHKKVFALAGIMLFFGGFATILHAQATEDLDMGGFQILNAGRISGTHFNATSASSTSNFAGGLRVGTTKLVVGASGNGVGIGIASPAHSLHILGDFALSDTGSSGVIASYGGDTTHSTAIQFNPTSKVGSGTSQHLRIVPTLEPATVDVGQYINLNTNMFVANSLLDVAALTGISALANLTPSYSGTVSSLRYFNAENPIVSGGSITNVSAIRVSDLSAGTGNNRGIELNLSSGTNKHNVYAGGTADNYFGGRVGIGTDNPIEMIHVNSTDSVRILAETAGKNAAGRFKASGERDWMFGLTNTLDQFTVNDINTPGVEFVVNTGGNVGIGTKSPSQKLHVETLDAATNTVTPGLRLAHFSTGEIRDEFGSGIEFELETPRGESMVSGSIESVWSNFPDSDASMYFNITSEGVPNGVRALRIDQTDFSIPKLNVAIGAATANDALDVNGQIRVAQLASGSGIPVCRNASTELSICSSSQRYKKDILSITGDVVQDILRLNPVTFRWNDDTAYFKNGEGLTEETSSYTQRNFSKINYGLIAEDVEEVFSEAVLYNEEDQVESIDYQGITALVIKAFQELVENIENTFAGIDKRITEIEEIKDTIILKDTDGEGCTEVVALNGVLSSRVVACP